MWEIGEKSMLEDVNVPIRLKLSALWAALMFCYVYGDYFGLYHPGQLRGMLHGDGPIGPTSQGTLVAVSILMAVPSLMVFLPVVLPPVFNRWTNIVLALLYTAIVVMTMPGSWAFYIFFSTVEIVLSLAIVWYAWKWPRTV
jgi:hypothetical protein